MWLNYCICVCMSLTRFFKLTINFFIAIQLIHLHTDIFKYSFVTLSRLKPVPPHNSRGGKSLVFTGTSPPAGYPEKQFRLKYLGPMSLLPQ